MTPEVIRTSSFIDTASDRILDLIHQTLKTQDYFILSLCGGSTPFPVYAELARKSGSLNWDKIFITFGDERCVSPDNPESNFYNAKEKFLDLVPIPSENILRMKGEMEPEKAALEYEMQLQSLMEKVGKNELIQDLVLLGMGDDGHTASLFPNTLALKESERMVVANFVHKLNSFRITLTFPVINRSKNIFFLINDSKKDAVVEFVLKGNNEYPASLIDPVKGGLVWIIGTK